MESDLRWTIEQVKTMRKTTLAFQNSPLLIEGGGLDERHHPVGARVTEELKSNVLPADYDLIAWSTAPIWAEISMLT